jgi:hypothetical protein
MTEDHCQEQASFFEGILQKQRQEPRKKVPQPQKEMSLDQVPINIISVAGLTVDIIVKINVPFRDYMFTMILSGRPVISTAVREIIIKC